MAGHFKKLKEWWYCKNAPIIMAILLFIPVGIAVLSTELGKLFYTWLKKQAKEVRKKNRLRRLKRKAKSLVKVAKQRLEYMESNPHPVEKVPKVKTYHNMILTYRPENMGYEKYCLLRRKQNLQIRNRIRYGWLVYKAGELTEIPGRKGKQEFRYRTFRPFRGSVKYDLRVKHPILFR